MRNLFFALIGAILAAVPAAIAQTPPSSSEIAAYSGVHAAAWAGQADEVRRLIDGGADPNAVDGAGRTPLHVAAFASHEDAAAALVKGGADPNLLDHERYDIITIAAVADDAEMVRHAVELGGNPRNVTSIYDGTALIAAAHLGHFEVVQVLIEAGAPLDHVNNLGWTALMEAVILGDGGDRHIRTVRSLVEAGADRTIADRQGRTPLDHARERGYAEMIAILEGGG
jgi:ankyrin repeat protein